MAEKSISADVHIEHVHKRQFKHYNIMVIAAMCFASMGMGYSASIIGTTLAQPSFLAYFHLDTRKDALSLISTMNGLFQAGAFFGSLGINVVGDRFGRKMSIIIPSLLVLVSGACLAGSVNVGMFIAFRFFSGMGSWWLLGSVPVWMSEVAPPKNRGVLVDCHSAALLFGYCAASWIGAGFYFYHPVANNQWRAPLGFQCLPVFIVLCFMHWLPESPRWLLQNDRTEEAERILLKLHDPDEAALELQQIRNQIAVDNTLENSWMSLVTKRSYRKRTFITLGLSVGIQMTGVLVINNYGPTIYASLGLSTSQQLLYQGGFNTLGFGCGILALLVVDRFSRPTLIAGGTAIVLATLVAEAALVASYPPVPGQSQAGLKGALAMIYLYIVFAEFLLDGTQYIYFSEVWPNHLRAKGMTIAMATIALVNIMWLQVAPTAFANIGWKFYLCFIIPGYIFAVCAWIFFPDTRHLALEEIAAIFGDADEIYHVQDVTKLSLEMNGKSEHQDDV
ncbi:general substrate transporter [Hyaloscypha bicolor E]|uniref:General substrate transporter n=1 Tax=Hyaloscypha bicolor E TaxID=1095630 RepID=A0A2J6SGZ3_9HELO|nr:general substrate transporter [Hyaloscypha bicolor E]PMD50042.1 general substrate transporter [Hyaloscypha bicolor E]